MKFGIIADDLTGANANCSLMKKIGLQAASIIDSDKEIPKDMDAVAFSTSSRAVTQKEAYTIVKNVAEKIGKEKPVFLSKRIDSTLRGNIGAELQACRDALGEDVMPVIVPAYPKTGRVVIDGKMYVNGNLLVNTDAGRDTKCPVLSNRVVDEFERQYKGDLLYVTIEEIEKGKEHLISIFQGNKAHDAIVFDAMTDDHIEAIAEALIESKVKFFTVDPGPFTQKVADLSLQKQKKYSKILLIIGSVTDITIKQIRELIIHVPVFTVRVDAKKLADIDCYEEEIRRATEETFESFRKGDFILLTTTPFNPGETKVDLSEITERTGMNIDDVSLMISHGLAKIGANLLNSDLSFAGVFTSGGDITVALTKELDASGIQIKDEIIPLAAYGRILGGKKPDLKIISKGGMVGDNKTLIKCLERLKNLGGIYE